MTRNVPRRRAVLTSFLWLLAAVAVGYVGVCALLWWLQDGMVFPGAGRGDRGVPATSPPATVAWLAVGESRVRTATVTVPSPRAVAVYFGGNGEDLCAAVGSAAELAAHGVEALAVEYPGYGASPGRPSVASLFATAEAAAARARARATDLQVPRVVVGSSLGSFCAVHVAAAGGADKLVLRAPPTSLVAVAKPRFWWLPLETLLAHRFDSLALAAKVRCPTLVLHGDADRIVADHYGRELAAAIPGASFVSVPGHGHNDLDLAPAGRVGATLRTFLTSP
jgi:uncharacterized protein